MNPVPRLDVLYDGGCGLCARTMVWLQRLDWLQRLRWVDIDTHWERLEQMYPAVRRDAWADEMHVVHADGGVTAGFDGFRTIAWQVPLLMPIAPLLYAPGVPTVGRRVYRYVATHRSSACTRRPAPNP